MAIYGSTWLLWSMNLLFDNEGGSIHYYLYKLSTLLSWAPWILGYFALDVNASYARNEWWYKNGIIDDIQVGSLDVADNEIAWLFNPGQTQIGLPESRDEGQVWNQQRNWLMIFMIAAVQNAVLPVLEDSYLAWTETETEAEAYPMEAAAEAEAEEEFFF